MSSSNIIALLFSTKTLLLILKSTNLRSGLKKILNLFIKQEIQRKNKLKKLLS